MTVIKHGADHQKSYGKIRTHFQRNSTAKTSRIFAGNMDFLNKPMSEVWRATKRTFNEIMEINNTDLSGELSAGPASGSGNPIARTQSEPRAELQAASINQGRYSSQNKTASLPRLQRPRESINIDDYHVVSGDSDDFELEFGAVGGPSWGGIGAEAHVSRSRLSPAEENERLRGSGSFSSYQARSRYRSNSSDRASMRNRNEDIMGKRLYHRSTSYDKAMENDIEDDDEEDDQAEKMKTKLMSMWNNMKYGWTVKSKTAFSLQKPIWFLGKCYQHRPSDPEPVLHPGMETVKSPQMELFKQDFTSRIWMTYRRDFPQLEGSTLTTDCGWGCMLRSGQMLLAQCLVTHFLGRGWNIYKEQTDEQDKHHHDILRWFNDQPSDMSPFSVHRLVHIGKNSGKKAGDWYGPASVSHILRDAMVTAPEFNPLFEEVCIYVAQDCTVYKQDVIEMCRNRNRGSPKPTCKSRPPTPHMSKRSETSDHQPSLQSTIQSSRSRETLINGHHDDGVDTSANRSPRKETALHDGITLQDTIPQKQTLYSPRGERTSSVTHNPLGNSAGVSRTRYYRSHSSSSSSMQDALGRDKRTKSESDAGDDSQLQETLEHPICRRNAVKEVKQGAGVSGSYMRGELKSPKSPDKTDQKWNWAEAKAKASQRHPEGARKTSHNALPNEQTSHSASPAAHSSHHAPLHGHHSYNLNLSGHKEHSHNATGSGRHSREITRLDYDSHNAPLYRPPIPPHAATVNRQNNPSQNAFGNDVDPLTYNSSGHSFESNSGVQSRLKPNQTTGSASRHSQNPPSHTPLQNGHALNMQSTSLHEPVWKRQSADFNNYTQVANVPSGLVKSNPNDISRHDPNWAVRNSPYEMAKNSANKGVRNGPSVSSRNSASWTIRSNPNEVTVNSANQGVSSPNWTTRHNPNKLTTNGANQAVRNSANWSTRNGPTEAMRSSPNEIMTNSANHTVRSSPNWSTRNNPTEEVMSANLSSQQPQLEKSNQHSSTPNQLIRSSPNQHSKETEINGVDEDSTQEEASTPSSNVKQPCPKEDDEETTKSKDKKNWCALILLVPVRLGGDDVNPIYVNPLRSLFTLDSCMGIIGGKPKHSLYYVGFQDEKLIHLDPHYCQPVVDMKSTRKFPTFSYHCMSPRKMRITNMDPSCTVGFYLKTEEDFEEFCDLIPEVVTPAQSSGDYPMFIVRDGKCLNWQESSTESDKKDRFLRIRHIDEDGRLMAPMKESEDFVFLES